MKRIIALMLCLVLLASNIVVVRAADAVEMTITPNKTQVARGEIVEFTVTLPETEVRSAGFTLGTAEDGLYDSKVLEFLDGTCPVEDTYMSSMGLTSGIPSGSMMFQTARLFSGVAFTFRMQVREDAPLGETSIQISPAVRNAAGAVTCTANTVVLKVEEPEAPPVEPPVETTVQMTIAPNKTEVTQGEIVEFTVTLPETIVRSAGFSLGTAEDGLYDSKVLEFLDGTCPAEGTFMASVGVTGGIPCGSMVFQPAKTFSGVAFTFRMQVKADAPIGETILTIVPALHGNSGEVNCTVNTVTLQIAEAETPVEPPMDPTEPPVDPTEPPEAPPVEIAVQMTVTPDKTEVTQGEIVEFTISVPKTENVRSAGFSLGDSDDGFYDPAVLQFVDGKCSVTNAFMSNVGIIGGIPSGSLAFASPSTIFGTIFTFRMQVLADATLGETVLMIVPSMRDDSVAMDCTANEVTLFVDKAEAPIDPPVDPTEPPEEPTEPPVEPTDPPEEPTEPPVEPTDPPEEPPVEAQVHMTVTPSKPWAARGEIVEFTISVSEIDNIRSAGFSLVDENGALYDADTLEFVDGECPVTGTIMSTVSVIGGKPCGSLAFMSATKLSGTIFIFRMKVLEDAALGETTLTIVPAVSDSMNTLICDANTTTLEITCAHKWDAGRVAVAPTCTVDGVENFICTICGDAKTEVIAKLGHTEKTEVTKEATCAEEGVKATSCSVCSEVIKTEAIEKLPHTEKTEVTKEATCAEEGVKTTSCSVCSEVLKTEAIAETEDHTYGDWTDNGENHKHTCAVCGKEETEAHTFDTTVWVTDAENHWHACSCGGKQDLQAHSFTEKIIDEAHKVPGMAMYYYDCAHCDVMGQETFSNGDADGNNYVNVDDAIYLLQYVLMPDLFPVQGSTDMDKNGIVNVDDAIYLLQHVLMPNLFPL